MRSPDASLPAFVARFLQVDGLARRPIGTNVAPRAAIYVPAADVDFAAAGDDQDKGFAHRADYIAGAATAGFSCVTQIAAVD